MKVRIKKKITDHCGIIMILVVSLSVFIYYDITGEFPVIESDAAGYYRYLPELFISKELMLSNKYGVGTALLLSPFFLVTHVFTCFLSPQMADGYSLYYEKAVLAAGLFYFTIGTIFVYKTIVKLYHKNVANAVCSLLICGTMLPVYCTRRAGFSHIYAYAACAVFLFLVVSHELERENWSKWQDVLAGGVLGLIFSIRNLNVVIILLYLLWGIGQGKEYLVRLKYIMNTNKLLRNATGFIFACMPQLLYWRNRTGHFLVLNSYEGEMFDFVRNPKIAEVLFSDAKGLFIFCPILIMGILGLLYFNENRKLSGSALVFFSIFGFYTYLYAAWWCWWLGAAYSLRSFCDMLPMFAIGMGAFWEHFINRNYCSRRARGITIGIYSIIAVGFCLSNIGLMLGVHRGVVDNNLADWYQLNTALKEFFRVN